MSILKEINEIMALAIEMRERNAAHVFVDYSGHINKLAVHAHPVDQVYRTDVDSEWVYLLDESIRLDREDACEALRAIRHEIAKLAAAMPEAPQGDELLAKAFEFRNEMALKGGLVVIYDGQATGWIHKLERPEGWAPGCIAIDEDGNRWVSDGGNDQDGATQWVEQ